MDDSLEYMDDSLYAFACLPEMLHNSLKSIKNPPIQLSTI